MRSLLPRHVRRVGIGRRRNLAPRLPAARLAGDLDQTDDERDDQPYLDALLAISAIPSDDVPSGSARLLSLATKGLSASARRRSPMTSR